MNEQNVKLLKQSIFIGLLIFLMVFLLLTLFSLFRYSYPGSILIKLGQYFTSRYFVGNLSASLSSSIGLIVAIFSGKKLLKTEKTKKVFYKMPLYALIPSILIIFLIVLIFGMLCGPYCVALAFEVVPYTLYVIIAIIPISLLFSAYYYFTREKPIVGKIIKIIAILIIFIELIYIISSLIYSSYMADPLLHYCGLPEKDPACYARHALEKNDPSICEKIIDISWKRYCYDQFTA